MKIGIYPGSFNPPHNGHIHVAKYLLENKYVDKILLLPTPNYWDKQNLEKINHRINMLKYYQQENIIIDNKHNNFPYTYQVLNSIKKDYKADSLYLIIGSDNLEKLHLWKNINQILNHKIIVLKRENKNITIPSKYQNKLIIINDFNHIDISSTQIRKNINNKYLPKEIQKYIKNNNLYNQ